MYFFWYEDIRNTKYDCIYSYFFSKLYLSYLAHHAGNWTRDLWIWPPTLFQLSHRSGIRFTVFPFSTHDHFQSDLRTAEVIFIFLRSWVANPERSCVLLAFTGAIGIPPVWKATSLPPEKFLRSLDKGDPSITLMILIKLCFRRNFACRTSFMIMYKKWIYRESNPGPLDMASNALPTEP